MKRGILWGWLLLTPLLAQATDYRMPDERDRTLDVSLRFASAKAPLDYSDGHAYDTTSSWIGLTLREQISPRLMLGMYGGYAYVTQTGNPVTAGIELDGYHAGFSLDGVLFESRNASLYYALDYTYQKVDNKTDTQTVVLDWSAPQALLGASVAIARGLRLYGGGGYGYIDGEERASGLVNHTTDFSRSSRAFGFLGLDLNVDPDGFVGIEAATGLTRRAEIYFKRRY